MGCKSLEIGRLETSEDEIDYLKLTNLAKLTSDSISDDDFKKMKLTEERVKLLDIDIILEIGKNLRFEDKACELPSLQIEKEPLIDKNKANYIAYDSFLPLYRIISRHAK